MNDIRAALASAGEWVMVPRVPTEAMVDAGDHSDNMNHHAHPHARIKHTYRAMLAAAPSAPAVASETGQKPGLDFDSDEPLVCNRDQSGDKPCESCQ